MVLATTAFAQPAGRLALADAVADALKANPETRPPPDDERSPLELTSSFNR